MIEPIIPNVRFNNLSNSSRLMNKCLKMRPHCQHDSLAHQGDVGQEVVTLVAHHNSVSSHFSGCEDAVSYLIVTKEGGGPG